ncbi:hypothetical protein M405DRAFT_833486 [Rhizopogon salebrosus TDB-379]|nr:hypothetical protein M405DRAFT_833486 [Rhizopogon salebrosus TDB-379]
MPPCVSQKDTSSRVSAKEKTSRIPRSPVAFLLDFFSPWHEDVAYVECRPGMKLVEKTSRSLMPAGTRYRRYQGMS